MSSREACSRLLLHHSRREPWFEAAVRGKDGGELVPTEGEERTVRLTVVVVSGARSSAILAMSCGIASVQPGFRSDDVITPVTIVLAEFDVFGSGGTRKPIFVNGSAPAWDVFPRRTPELLRKEICAYVLAHQLIRVNMA